MPESSDSTPPSSSVLDAFGANEWLVDEMYEQYQRDPNSVDKAWWDFFKQHGQGATARPAATTARAGRPAPRRPRRRRRRPPSGPPARPRSRLAQKPREQARRRPPRRPRRRPPGRPRPTAVREAEAERSPRPSPSRARGEEHQDRAVDRDPEVHRGQGPAAGAEERGDRRADLHRAARRPRPHRRRTWTPVADRPDRHRVRSVPVKLLWDNRIVINNHLARARGGKVSFTHLIGYALVKALQGDAGDERRLRRRRRQAQPDHAGPHQPRPGDRPAEARRHPPAAGAAHQGRRDDGLRGASGRPTRRSSARPATTSSRSTDFQGTTISLTNPGTIGTNHSVPRLMKGQGAIIGVGAMEYPPECQGASEETLDPQRDQQGHDADLDLRPPGHPGRAVAASSSSACTRCCSARTTSTTRSSARCGSPTSRSAGPSDISTSHDDEISKQARILELIHAYRVRGHMMADTDPLEYQPAQPPRPRGGVARADPVGPRPRVRHRLVRRRGPPVHEAAQHPRHPARLLLPHRSASSTCTSRTPSSAAGSRSASSSRTRSRPARSSCGSCSSSTRPRRSRPSCRPSSSARSGSASRAARPRSR